MARKTDSALPSSALGDDAVSGANSSGSGFGGAELEGANADVANLTFEQAREELHLTMDRLEAGGEPLEGQLALWARGKALAAHCQSLLEGARNRFEAVTGGNASLVTAASSFGDEPF